MDKMKKAQGYILAFAFVLLLLAGALTLFVLPDSVYSEAERRPLATIVSKDGFDAPFDII